MTVHATGLLRALGSSMARRLLSAVLRISPRGECGWRGGTPFSPTARSHDYPVTARLQQHAADALTTSVASAI